MDVTTQVQDDLFDGGPPLRWQKSLGLVRSPTERRTARRVLLAVVVGWVPLAALTAVRAFAEGDGAARTFFTDFAAYARFLVAAPLFIAAEADAIHRFGRVARHFLEAGFIAERDAERYAAAVSSTRRLLDSNAADAITLLLAYALMAALLFNLSRIDVPPWWRGTGPSPGLSVAGWWHALVSLPLLLVLFLGWLWRVLLWARFLWLMARLDLRLVAAHPDEAGGLKFVNSSLKGFRLLAIALGAVVAGTEANHVLHEGQSPLGFRNSAIGVTVFVIVLAAGPLVVFIRRLRSTKRAGIFHYGALADEVGREFERKWLARPEVVGPGVLEVPDFSATTDLYGIVGNVYEMNFLPFGWKNLIGLVVMTLLPFAPVALLAVPLDKLLQALMKLLT